MRLIELHSLVNRRQRRKLAAVQSLRRRSARLGLGCGIFALLALVILLLLLGLAYASLVVGLPSLSQLPQLLDPSGGLLMQPTRLYDRSGKELLLSLENPGITRRYLSIDPNQAGHFSPQLSRAVVGVFDPNFWNSPGISLRSLTDPEPVTIAERVVNDLLLWNEPRGLRRTLRMRLLAAQLISRYGHVQTLEWYLNSMYYGHLAFGADSAARLYLDKSAAGLNLPEAALLVAASQAPALNALDAPAAALERQQAVLELLRHRGIIPEDEYRKAAGEKLRLAQPVGQAVLPAAAFSNIVLKNLSERFGRERLERGGLRIITTLDYDLQIELSCLARTQLDRLAGKAEEARLPDGKPCLSARLLPTLPPSDQPLPVEVSASAVVLDPQTGQVLALLGDSTVASEAASLSPRPPGSLLTPFVAVAGFARGMGPASLSWDIPAASTGPVENTSSTAVYENPDGKYHGPVRLRMALANDYLSPLAQLLEQVGATNVWQQAGALGLSIPADARGADLLYSGGQVSPLELAQAYGVFASLGMRRGQRMAPNGSLRPASVLYVEDLQGNAWLDARQTENQVVLSPQLAYLIHHVLSDDTARRPSLGYPNPLEIGRPAGSKIGQVAGGRQVWAAGYTPQRVAVISLSLPGESEGNAAVLRPVMASGIWHALMQFASQQMPVANWAELPGISHLEVCDPSGLLPTESCPEIVNELFLSGSEPNGPDTLYRVFQVNRETGRLATVFTPPLLVEEKTFLVIPEQARSWADKAGLPLPPQEYDAIQPPEPSLQVRISEPELFSYVHGQVTLRGSAAPSSFRYFQLQVGQGINPQNWLQIGPDGTSQVRDGVLGVWDTQGQEGLYSVRLLVVHQDQTAETAFIQVTVDNTAPLVHIPYPLNGQEFSASQTRNITFQVEASDAIGVSRLVWQVDGADMGETAQAPYVFSWKVTRGDHHLVVRAYDLAGNEGKSEEVTFSVK